MILYARFKKNKLKKSINYRLTDFIKHLYIAIQKANTTGGRIRRTQFRYGIVDTSYAVKDDHTFPRHLCIIAWASLWLFHVCH